MTVDLRTRYLGLDLRSPIVASASPLTGELASARRLEQAGAAAIVLPSLFEEEIVFEEIEINRSLEAGTDSSPRRWTTSPTSDRSPVRATGTWPGSGRSRPSRPSP